MPIQLINGIEWDMDQLVDNSQNLKRSSLLLKLNNINRLPLVGGYIYFQDDIWDLTGFSQLPIKKSMLVYDFMKIPYEYRPYVKGLVLKFMIIDKIDFSTLRGKFYNIINITSYLKSYHIYDYSLITLKTVKDYYNRLKIDLREESKKSKKETFLSFLKYINSHISNLDYNSIYKYLEKYDNPEVLKGEREAGKTQDIPVSFFDQMVSCAVKDILSNGVDQRQKKKASTVLLLSQIGMRVGELVQVEANKDSKMNIFDDTKSISYLKFKTFKTIEENDFVWTKSILTDLAVIAYSALEGLDIKHSNSGEEHYLFWSTRIDSPLNEQTIRNWILQFIASHRDEIDCINRDPKELEGFDHFTIERCRGGGSYYLNSKLTKGLKSSDVISFPTPHQFRVAVCTRLYEQGRDLDWVREHMNHLTEEMTIHYIRRKEKSKKDKEFAQAILKEIVSEEFRLIGSDSDILMEKIREFIKVNGFNVNKDIDTIVNILAGKMPIREKAEGFCMKGAFGRKCAHDGVNNEIYCAFELCPNHCFSFKSANVTYCRYLSKKKAIEYNILNGFTTEVKNETNKIRRLISERLVPELDELQYELTRRGTDTIKASNPDLVYIIDNLNEIVVEGNKWLI